MQTSLTIDPRKLAFMERAEHELASFHQAVAELYGSAEADRAAEDWLSAFESARGASASLAWHRISQTAASRLASRRAADQPGPIGRMRQMLRRTAHTPCFCSSVIK